MHGNFFWIITLTDRKTQWTEIYPVWNKGAEEVLNAMEILVKRFPSNIIASMFKFKEEKFFEVDNSVRENVPQVKF